MFCPIKKNILPYPICGKILVDYNHNVISNLPIIKLSSNTFYVNIQCDNDKNIEVLSQENISEHLITIHRDFNLSITIENSTHFIQKNIPTLPKKINHFYTEYGIIFLVLCENFLLIISYDYNDYNVLIYTFFSSIKFESDGIFLTQNLLDNQGRVKHFKLYYFDGEYLESDVSFEYKNRHNPIKELLVYDIVDSIKAKDYNYLANFLCENDDLYPKKICDFFGNDFDLILLDKEYSYDSIITIKKSDNTILSYQFVINNNQIIDIIELDNI